MRDRLIELIKQSKNKTPCKQKEKWDCSGIKCDDCESMIIADYLLANGVIVPPCKVGETIYCIDEHNLQVNECEVTRMELDFNSKLVIVYEQKSFRGRRYGCTVDYFGKTIFSTIEEAEKELKRYGKFDQ